jgi:hypothetical protein
VTLRPRIAITSARRKWNVNKRSYVTTIACEKKKTEKMGKGRTREVTRAEQDDIQEYNYLVT